MLETSDYEDDDSLSSDQDADLDEEEMEYKLNQQLLDDADDDLFDRVANQKMSSPSMNDSKAEPDSSEAKPANHLTQTPSESNAKRIEAQIRE